MKSPRIAGKRGEKVKIDPAHIGKLHKALEAAGLGEFRIASMHLTPVARDAVAEAHDCHAELQSDGSYKIVC